MKVFLGGSTQSNWRNFLISYLDQYRIDYFNPIVDNWDDSAIKKEYWEKESSDIHLYILVPLPKGFFTFFEIAESLYTHDDIMTCVFVFPETSCQWSDEQVYSIEKILGRVNLDPCGNGSIGKFLPSLGKDKDISSYTNRCMKEVADVLFAMGA